jgi:hypothetical protein
MRIGQRPQAFEEAVWRTDDAAVALDRLDDDRRQRPDAGPGVLQRVADKAEGGVPGASRTAELLGPAIRVGVGEEMGIGVKADTRADRRLAVEPDDPAGSPEVAARERQDLATPGPAASQLDGRVVGVGTTDPQQDAIEAGGMPSSSSSNPTRCSLIEADETWLTVRTWAATAATTSGWLWPTVAAAKLPARSV